MNDDPSKTFWDGVERRNAGEIATVAAKIATLHDDVAEVKTVLRDLTAAITKLALVEERQLQLTSALDRAFAAISKLSDRLFVIERTIPEQSKVAIWVDRAIIATAGAALLYVAKHTGLM